MPSPLHHCTSLAELQDLIVHAERAYPQLGWRARAAGGLIAGDAIEPHPRFRRFRVAGAFGDSHLVDLLDGTCPCPDRHAPVVGRLKLCAHVLACLVLRHLDQRFRHLLAFFPKDCPSPGGARRAWLLGDDIFGPGQPPDVRPDFAPERPFWDADDNADPPSPPCRFGHPTFVMAADGTRCLWCDDTPPHAAEDDPLGWHA